MASTTSLITGRLPPLPSMRDIIKLYKLKALKQLSQNFLLDEKLNNKIVNVAGFIQDSEICEVGPGPGNITRSIINHGAEKVFVIEKDKRFIPALEMLADAASQPLLIINGDALTFNMEKLFSEEKLVKWEDDYPKIQLIGNLPFNVSTPLIIKWVEAMATRSSAWRYGRVRMTLTFQKEVAERMASPVMTSQRCRLSVMCQNWCRVEHRFTIPGRAFLPKPQVDVGVVHFKPLIKPIIPLPFWLVEKVVRCLFSQRRAPSIKGLQILFPHPVREKLTNEMFEVSELDPKCKPFQFTIPEIGRLCAAYKKIIDREPSYIKYNQHDKKDPHYWEDKEAEEEMKSKQVLEDIEKECEHDETLPKMMEDSDASESYYQEAMHFDNFNYEESSADSTYNLDEELETSETGRTSNAFNTEIEAPKNTNKKEREIKGSESEHKIEHIRNALDTEMETSNKKERKIKDSSDSEHEFTDDENSSFVDDAGHTDWETDSSDDESFEREWRGNGERRENNYQKTTYARVPPSNYGFKNSYKRNSSDANDVIRRMEDDAARESIYASDNSYKRNSSDANDEMRRMEDDAARESIYASDNSYKRNDVQLKHRFGRAEDTNDYDSENSYKRNVGVNNKKRKTYNDELPSFLTEGDTDYEFQSLEDIDNTFENVRDDSGKSNVNSNKKIAWVRPEIKNKDETPNDVEPDFYDDDLRLSRKFRKHQMRKECEEPRERSTNKTHFDWNHNKSLGFEGDRVINEPRKRIVWKNTNIEKDGEDK